MKKAFTLVELMIVVAILGILAAIALPQFQNNTVQAKESVAKDMLHTMRAQIEMYKMQHNGLTPGYIGTSAMPPATIITQLEGTSAITGAAVASKTPTSPYLYGPYVQKVPANPFNGLSSFKYVPLATDFSAVGVADNLTGWLYKKETGDIRLNKSGTDLSGDAYTSY